MDGNKFLNLKISLPIDTPSHVYVYHYIHPVLLYTSGTKGGGSQGLPFPWDG